MYKEIIFSLVAGVLVALAVEATHLCFNYYKKKKIQAELSTAILENLNSIFTAERMPGPPTSKIKFIEVHEIQAGYYRKMRRTVTAVLNHSGHKLKLEDEMNLREPFAFMEEAFFKRGIFPPLEFYQNEFLDHLKKVKWLKIN